MGGGFITIEAIHFKDETLHLDLSGPGGIHPNGESGVHTASVWIEVTNYSAVTNQKALKGDFAVRTPDLGWMTGSEYNRLKLTNGVTQVSSPFGSKAYGILSLDDATKISPDEIVVHVVVFQNGQPKWTFDFKGFDDFDADWIDEKTLKIIYWPGTHAKATELIDVETGKVIYRSQYGIYDRPE